MLALLFAAKMVPKLVGVYPLARRYYAPHAAFTTLLMSTGLTFGTISSLYGLQGRDHRPDAVLAPGRRRRALGDRADRDRAALPLSRRHEPNLDLTAPIPPAAHAGTQTHRYMTSAIPTSSSRRELEDVIFSVFATGRSRATRRQRRRSSVNSLVSPCSRAQTAQTGQTSPWVILTPDQLAFAGGMGMEASEQGTRIAERLKPQ